jgi:hypothetical protein
MIFSKYGFFLVLFSVPLMGMGVPGGLAYKWSKKTKTIVTMTSLLASQQHAHKAIEGQCTRFEGNVCYEFIKCLRRNVGAHGKVDPQSFEKAHLEWNAVYVPQIEAAIKEYIAVERKRIHLLEKSLESGLSDFTSNRVLRHTLDAQANAEWCTYAIQEGIFSDLIIYEESDKKFDRLPAGIYEE